MYTLNIDGPETRSVEEFGSVTTGGCQRTVRLRLTQNTMSLATLDDLYTYIWPIVFLFDF